MTFEEAMQLISDATANVQADRRTHQAIVQAIDTVFAAFKEREQIIDALEKQMESGKAAKPADRNEAEQQDEAVN